MPGLPPAVPGVPGWHLKECVVKGFVSPLNLIVGEYGALKSLKTRGIRATSFSSASWARTGGTKGSRPHLSNLGGQLWVHEGEMNTVIYSEEEEGFWEQGEERNVARKASTMRLSSMVSLSDTFINSLRISHKVL